MVVILSASAAASFSVRCFQQALVQDDIPGHLHLAAAHQHSTDLYALKSDSCPMKVPAWLIGSSLRLSCLGT